MKGYVSSAFEVINEEKFRTISKTEGWSNFKGGSGSTTINGKKSIIILADECEIEYEENSDFGSFASSENKYYYTENFELSFWVKSNNGIENDIKIWTYYNRSESPETICDIVSKDKTGFQSIVLYILGKPDDVVLEIADVRIKQDIRLKERGEDK